MTDPAALLDLAAQELTRAQHLPTEQPARALSARACLAAFLGACPPDAAPDVLAQHAATDTRTAARLARHAALSVPHDAALCGRLEHAARMLDTLAATLDETAAALAR